jgi:hypothetical protein
MSANGEKFRRRQSEITYYLHTHRDLQGLALGWFSLGPFALLFGMIRHAKITSSEPRKAAMRSSKVTFSSPSPKSILNSLNSFASDHRAGHADQEVCPATQALLFQSDSSSRERARESADNDPHNDLAKVHDLNATLRAV